LDGNGEYKANLLQNREVGMKSEGRGSQASDRSAAVPFGAICHNFVTALKPCKAGLL
jgi:hypothetical protein